MIRVASPDDRNPDLLNSTSHGCFAKVIEQLNQPLSAVEMADGWSIAAKLGFAGALIEIAKAELPRTHPNRIHLARAMDHWGISSGVLADEILEANTRQ